jgi:hypothetical protein
MMVFLTMLYLILVKKVAKSAVSITFLIIKTFQSIHMALLFTVLVLVVLSEFVPALLIALLA